MNTIYYALDQTDLNNFSSWVSSNIFDETTKDLFEEEVFPVEMIWLKSNDIYFIRRPLPELADSLVFEQIRMAQTEIQSEIRALLIDWRRFYSGRLLSNMPAEYVLETHGDTITLDFTNTDENGETHSKLYFGRNGVLLKSKVLLPDSSQTILTYPEYKYTGEYWLCTGWQVQIVKKDQVESGFRVKILSKRNGKYWIPNQFQMTLKTSDFEDKVFVRIYSFRNIRLNRDIQVLGSDN